MRTLLCAGLILAGLGGAMPATAGTWSIQGGDQHFDLNSSRSAVDSRDAYFLGASYWFAPDLAVDLGYASSDKINIDESLLATTLSLRSLRLGARKEWTLAPQWSLDAAAGADLIRVSRELLRVDSIYTNPDTGALGSVFSFYRHRRQNLAPYLGLGIGWHPDPAWTLRFDVQRSLADVGVGCRADSSSYICRDHASARLDSVRVGFEYRFR